MGGMRTDVGVTQQEPRTHRQESRKQTLLKHTRMRHEKAQQSQTPAIACVSTVKY